MNCSPPGLGARVEGCADGGDCVDRRNGVANRCGELARLLVVEPQDPAQGVGHPGVEGAVGLGALMPEAGDRTVDQGGIAFSKHRVAEPEALHHPRPEVLHHHIRERGQRERDGAAGGMLEVQRDRPLAVVVAEEADVPPPGNLTAGVVALAWLFDFDHLGAEVGQDARGVRASDDAGEVEDADACQHACVLNTLHRQLL
ncbi:MAG: hypothetical protein KatS3mg061_2433 [Dehalococcoidia bacterium]|nr:MAG: hypothetical protein KatS3mg061_2433 [Dehalococcoidia bacterium]